ncbi:MAG: cytochrome [Actinomycetia bacterium]|nr:cytochrome [Actinomycetes bacterium]
MSTPTFPSVATQGLSADPLLDVLRRQAPTFRIKAPYGGECWMVTRHEDVRAVQTDPRFSRRAMIGQDVARTSPYPLQGESIVGMDPPDHTRIRRLVSMAFTARRVESLPQRAQALVDGLLDEAAAADGPVDLVEGLAQPLPIAMICELLGVAYEDRSRFRGWANVFMTSTAHPIEDVLTARDHLFAYLAELVASRRAQPTTDLLGALVLQRDEGDALTEDELVNLAFSLLVGGFETTAAQLAKSVLMLLLHPDQLALVRADPELVPTAVEELLRVIPLSSGTSLAWVATEDVVVGDVTIRAGDVLMASAAAANLDEAVFDQPERFDVTRSPNPHLSFGHGLHFCLGAHLARMELQVAIGSLATRFPDLRLAVAPDDVPWKVGSAVWGLAALPVLVSAV